MKSAPRNKEKPSVQEINTLGALFADRQYSEAATLAQTLTVRYPLNAIGWTTLGVAFSQMGRKADALAPMKKAAALSPDDADAHSNLGYTLHALGRLEEAEKSCRRAIQIKPDFAEAHNNLGNTLRDLGLLVDAEASYKNALQIKPGFAEVYNNLGNIYRDLGRLDEAEQSYRRALQIKPDFAEAHGNLGNTHRDLGKFDEAEKSYRWALRIKPGFAEAHCNLGNMLRDLGRIDEAEVCCRRALQIKPDYVDALNSLALLLNGKGDPMLALNIIKQSLQIKETEEAKNIFLVCIKRLHFTHDDNEIRATMVRALTEPWGRPSDLVRVGVELVKFNPDFAECVTRAVGAWPLRLSAQELYGSNNPDTIGSDPLLSALLDSAPISDIELERFLTMARNSMLVAATEITASGDEAGTTLSFYCALARQCFINEYVFSYMDDEIQAASDLKDALAAAVEVNAPVPKLWLLAVAAYFPLYSLPFATRLLERQWPEEVAAVLVQQVIEPGEELQLRTTIPQLTTIDDGVSLLVQRQYEENPYPRWIKAAPAGKAKSIDGYLNQKFPLASFKHFGKGGKIDVLVAGCGTGQHAIGTAQQFLGGHVLAIDLSMSSLGYAKRKAIELGLTSIEFAQADLLMLGTLGRSFDIVESAGVLHHLADPWAGWRVLLSLLRPDGLMRLGFYSEIARRNIVPIRAFIAENGYGDTASEIRRCRQDLLDMDKSADFGNILKSADFGNILKSADFFSISECRDLLFHVQEHRMTLDSIDAFLRANNLTFLGFDIATDILQAYKHRFPDDRAATNLSQWQTFEIENPDTFVGMYQFLIQKSGS